MRGVALDRRFKWMGGLVVALLAAVGCSSGTPHPDEAVDTPTTTSSSVSTVSPTSAATPLASTTTVATEPLTTGFFAPLAPADGERPEFARYPNAGALADPTFYPIAVWWQYPWQAAAYGEMGVNTYIWPDTEGFMCSADTRARCLEGIVDAGMQLVVVRDSFTTAPAIESSVIAWFTCDEPDIIEFSRKNCGGAGVTYDDVIVDLAVADPTRPIYTNFSDGLARPELDTDAERFSLAWLDGLWDQSNPVDDPDPGPAESRDDFLDRLLPTWCEASGLKSTDAYWFSSDSRQGPIWYYGRNITTAKERCGPDHPIMNAVETAAQGTSGTGTPVDPSPGDVVAMVYSSVAAGADGILYFPQRTDNGGSVRGGSTFLSNPHWFDAAPEITDPGMYDTLRAANETLGFLAPVLNSGPVDTSELGLGDERGVVDVLVRQHGGEVFLVSIPRQGPATLDIDLSPLGIDGAVVHVVTGLGSDEREMVITEGRLADDLAALTPSIYRVVPSS
ncbi:MAG: hypothetical protein GY929_27325 [Actinomycetia bacterium]|nr:hypothetical protein [Actinomycetes bacterium]